MFQLLLKSQLQDFIDTQKYTKLIDDENIRRAKEKEEQSDAVPQAPTVAAPQPEIKINTEYFEKAGLELPEGETSLAEGNEADLSADLDAEYFAWKEGEEAPAEAEEGKNKSVFSLFSKKDA